MQDRKRLLLFLAICAAMVLLSLFIPLPTTHAQSTATLTTDQKFYSVGQGMVIYGKGFSRNAPITVTVTRPDHLTDAIAGVGSDGNGSFTAKYAPPQEPGRYDITATDGVNTATVAKTEADAIGYNKGVYKKADTSYQGGPGKWTTGDAGSNYLEGQWAFYQYEVTGVGTTIPDFDVSYNHFQKNANAIFLDSSANWRACFDCGNISTTNTIASGTDAGMLLDGQFAPPADLTDWINAAPAVHLLNHPFDSTNTCTSAIDPPNSPTQLHCFHVSGADLKNALNAALNAKNNTGGVCPPQTTDPNHPCVDYFSSNSHTVTLYWAAHLAATRTWSKGNEYLLGCATDPNYVVGPGQGAEFTPFYVAGQEVYNSTQAAANTPCGQDSNSWTGIFNGIGAATGSSRHFELLNQTLGSNGAIDLPIPSVPAPTAQITIVKVTNPAVALKSVFGFTGSGGIGTFNLDTDPSLTNPSSRTFAGLGGGATYTVGETSMPGGWTNTNIACVNNSGNSTFSYSPSNSGGSVDITLDTAKNTAVTCTFTNLAASHIIVNKNISPASATFAHFPFATTGTGYSGFSLIGGTSNLDGANPPAGGLAPGTYTISEGSPVTAEGGSFWRLNSVSCKSANSTSTFTTSTTQPTSVNLAAGDTVTCDYNNVWPDGNVTIDPLAPKNEVNSAETFTITVNAVPDNPNGPVLFTGTGLGITTTVTPTPDLQNSSTDCASPAPSQIVTGTNLVTLTCHWTINSSKPGTFNVHVEAKFSVDGVTLTRDTGSTTIDAFSPDAGPAAPGANSSDAVKTYIAPGTTLSLTTPPASTVHAGDTVTLTVTETNTGGDPLTNVTVAGGGACTGNITPTSPISLAAGASQAYTCSFKAVDGANAWSATGNGTDSLNNAVSTTNEVQSGSVTGISPATTLSLTTPPPAKVHTGDTVNLTVTETNSGDDALTNVTVTGTGACAGNITPTAPITLAVGASQAYTCSFKAVDGANAWSATGNGTDSLNLAVPTTNEVQSGTVTGVSPATTLSLTTPPAAKAHAGDTVTLTVTETNSGDDALTNVTVTGGGACAGNITPTAPITLAVGASQAYTCSFTAVDGANAWSATGNGTDSLNLAVPTTNEVQSGTVTGISPATTLSLTTPPPASAEAGSTVTLVVTETNTGDDTLGNVTVTGGGACAGNITPTAPISLAPGAFQAYTCSFKAAAGANAWSAAGNGTDSLGKAEPTTNESQSGSMNGISATTSLTQVSQSPSGTVLEAGTSVTITVNEANTGNSDLTAVSVTGSPCTTWVGPTSLAAGTNANYTCTFNAVVGTNNWSANGHGTDSLGNAESATNEQQSGSFSGVLSTLIVVKNTVGGNGTFSFAGGGTGVPSSFSVNTSNNAGSATFAGILSGPKSIAETVPAGWLGNTTNVSCSETVPGITSSSVGSLTTGAVAAGGTITANVSLGIGATVTCTFTNALLPTLNIIKNSTGLGGPFNFTVTGPSPETDSLTVSSGSSAQTGVHSISVGDYTFAEDQATLPPGFSMTDLSCSNGAGSQPNNNGIPTLWSFSANYGDAITCEATNSNVGTTRTQGFWSTHTALANNVWNGTAGLPNETALGADALLCTANPITAISAYPPNPGANQLMGGFWASISQLSAKGKRTPLDQARMQMLQQYLAAVLNVHAFGTVPPEPLSVARTAYCGTDVNAIKAQVGILGTFNQSGDNQAFTPGASATTQESKKEANIPFWDVTFE